MPTATHHRRAAIAALATGLVLSVAAALVPYVDRATGERLATHIQQGYPSYGAGEIDHAVTLYLIYLSALGALGVAGWAATIWAVRRGARWTAPLATALLVTATAVALFNVFVTDTSGDTGLPLAISAVGLAPCVAGLAAVVLLWRRA